MKILAIETSCDETAAAIVEDGRKIISNIVATSAELHAKTGGFIPEIAARQQVLFIIPVIEEATLPLRNEKKGRPDLLNTFKKIDALAVTVGPGLIGSLVVGVEAAKTIAMTTGKPIIPVNHVKAHLYANLLNGTQKPDFPAIGLVVSGGHTELYFWQSINNIKWIGGTIDDAAGEAFDKTARILGLGFPGGPAIAAEAVKIQFDGNPGRIQNIKLPRPMMKEDSLNFSFSGLKTAVKRTVDDLKMKNKFNGKTVSYLSYEIQESITDVLSFKTILAAEKYKVKTIALGGGVAANLRLKEKLTKESGKKIRICVPPPSFCTDNALYIASCAFHYNNPVSWKSIEADPGLSVEV